MTSLDLSRSREAKTVKCFCGTLISLDWMGAADRSAFKVRQSSASLGPPAVCQANESTLLTRSADYGVITRAILAPLPTRRLLARANDPIYTDLPSEDDDDECFSRQSSLAASAASPSIPMEALLRIPSMVDTLVGDGGGGQGKGKQERMRIGRSTTFEEVHVESQVIAVATSEFSLVGRGVGKMRC
jgi:hypothetical protein